MFDSVVAIAGRLQVVGPGDTRLTHIGLTRYQSGCAVERRQFGGDAAIPFDDDVTPVVVASPGELMDGLPNHSHGIVFGADMVSGLRESIGTIGLPLVDLAELAEILYPAEPERSLDAMLALRDVPLPQGDHPLLVCESMLDLFGAMVGDALALPLPVLEALQTVLSHGVSGSLPRLFVQLAGAARAEQSPQDAGVPHDPHATASALAASFRSERLPRPRLEIPTSDLYEPLEPSLVDDTLGPEGTIAQGLPAYEYRAEQAAMCSEVLTALNDSRHLLVEAGTGVGKSLGYLVPCVAWAVQNKTPVIVSTNTKNLQSQLFEKDLPLLHSVMKQSFTAALLKGRQNYLCLRKLTHLVEHGEYELGSRSSRLRVAAVLVWSSQTKTGDIAELALSGDDSGGLAMSITATSEECAWRACRFYGPCFLHRARAHSLAADVVVANHSLVFAEMGLRSPALPPYQHLVLDEAHNLEEAATQHFSIEVAWSRLRYLIRRLGALKRGKGAGVLAALIHQVNEGTFTADRERQNAVSDAARRVAHAAHDVEVTAKPFFRRLADVLPASRGGSFRLDQGGREGPVWNALDREREQLEAAVRNLMTALDNTVQALHEANDGELGLHAEFVQELTAMSTTCLEFCNDSQLVFRAEDDDYVFWVETVPRGGGSARAIAAPVAIGGMLSESLYRQKASVIFCSATMSVRRSFNFLSQRLGITEIDPERMNTYDAGSPFDYASQCRVLVPMWFDDPSDGDGQYVEQLGTFLGRLFQRTRGRGMSLFTSHDMLRRTTTVLDEALAATPINVYAQGISGTREAIATRFRDDVESVLMGTHSFWEGVDMVGETLSCLVVARLPFAVFTDPIVQARSDRVEAEGKSAFMHYAVPNAVIRFRQGFGRLIRHRHDRGIVIVTDRRILTKRYGQWFRESIPAPTVKCYEEDQLMEHVDAFLRT